MTREIKFRGKGLYNGEWITGTIYDDGGEYYIIPSFPGSAIAYEDYQVDQNTVGQLTGLRDKNERDIYEGDIIRHGNELYKVVFEDACFWRVGKDDTMELHTILGMGECEVVGNIHDNPEMRVK